MVQLLRLLCGAVIGLPSPARSVKWRSWFVASRSTSQVAKETGPQQLRSSVVRLAVSAGSDNACGIGGEAAKWLADTETVTAKVCGWEQPRTQRLNGSHASRRRPTVGKPHRNTWSAIATLSTVIFSSVAFERWAFVTGRLRRDRRGKRLAATVIAPLCKSFAATSLCGCGY
jgi:hypothetical protein